MINFTKPDILNGQQLLDELKNVGIVIERLPFIDDNGQFWLDVNEKDTEKVAGVVALHVGIDEDEERLKAKASILDRIGLTEDELKTILG